MNQIVDLNWRREFGDCFYLEIPLDSSIEEIKARISRVTSVEQAVKSMLDGELNLEEMIEEVEPILLDLDINMDNYLEVVEDNMEYTLLSEREMQEICKY